MNKFLSTLLLTLFLVWSGCTPLKPATTQPTAPAATQPTTATKPAPTTQVATTTPATKPLEGRAKAMRAFELNRLSTQAYAGKQYAKAMELLAELVRLTPEDGTAWYNLACLQCLTGKLDASLESLDKSIKLGYAEIRHLQRDPDLKALHDHPRFQAILKNRDQIQRDRADKVLAALRKQMGEGYTYEIDHAHRLIYASCVDAEDFAEIKQRLGNYQLAEAKTLFDHSVDQYVAVVIPKDAPQRPGQPAGFYNPVGKYLVVKSIGMVLTHEFTHALHGADQEALGQNHAIWVVEGLATLFESSQLKDGRVTPLPNGRINVMQELIKSNQHIPLEKFLKVDHMTYAMRNPKVCYSQGQCLMRYLHAHGLLKKWYDTYAATFDKDPTGAMSLEKVTGKKLPDLEKEWKAWVLAQKPVPTAPKVNQPYVGVQLAHSIAGIRILSTVPGAGADKAGMKAGDVIVRLGGKRMVDPETLTEFVAQCKVGQTLPVEYRRAGKIAKCDVLLTARPAETQPATKPASAPATKP